MELLENAKSYLPVLKERRGLDIAKGKVLAALFYEPSTRTRFSFEAAMLRLGGTVISNAMMKETSSAKKGESLHDTAQTVSRYADIIAMRHPEPGSVPEFAEGSIAPVMNGGDGAADHPTQGLLDIFTIWQHFGGIENLTIGCVGDMKFSRVVRSECQYLRHFKGLKFIFVTPEALKMNRDVVDMLKENGFEVEETEDLESVIGECDIISQTRIQQERFESEEEYLKYKGVYVMTPELMSKAKESAILMHPLPRVDEIQPAVDSDPRAVYFDQVRNGVAIRMALITKLLGL